MRDDVLQRLIQVRYYSLHIGIELPFAVPRRGRGEHLYMVTNCTPRPCQLNSITEMINLPSLSGYFFGTEGDASRCECGIC